MNPLSILTGYFGWHYTEAFSDIIVVWSNLARFIAQFFSMPRLLATLFSPWKRMKEDYHGGSLEDLYGSIVVNVLSRVVGAIVRLGLIIMGLCVLVLMCAALALFLVFWLIAPAVAVGLILSGFTMVF